MMACKEGGFMADQPAILYKYRMVNAHTERIFTHNELWCSSVLELNDPFECFFTATATAMTHDELNLNRNQFRICAFAEKNDNLLMWAHYTAFHKGICLVLHSWTQ